MIGLLREAEEDYKRRRSNPIPSEDEAVPEPFRVQLDYVGMFVFLREGLERVLEGDPDPFRLNIGHRRHVLPRHKRVAAVIEALRLIQEGMTPGEAARAVAKKFPVSHRTIQNWMNDPDIRKQVNIARGLTMLMRTWEVVREGKQPSTKVEGFIVGQDGAYPRH